MEAFRIDRITIGKNCSPNLLKNLQVGEYVLCSKPIPDFFEKNISVSAIVGCSGSGKTSLLDILFRVVNNLGFVVAAKSVKRRAAHHMYYIPGLYASIEYHLGEVRCVLSCCGDYLTLQIGDERFYLPSGTLMDMVDSEIPEGYTRCDTKEQQTRIEIASKVFYTIVTNYSVQSFNSQDYAGDKSTEFADGGTIGVESDGIWMDSLFDKNDGYLVPITLNPYKKHGVFDMTVETELTKGRLSALLIQSKSKGREFLEGYQLGEINYTYNSTIVGEKILKYVPESEKKGMKIRLTISSERAMEFYGKYKDRPHCFFHVILDAYKIDLPGEGPVHDACIYLAYKTLAIAGKYPSYAKYEKLGSPWYLFQDADKSQIELLYQLVGQTQKDKSHITTKITQTLLFIRKFKDYKYDDKRLLSFDNKTYANILGEERQQSGSVEHLMEILPPPFYDYEISFVKRIGVVQGIPVYGDKMIPLCGMSSGERQFLYMMSTLVYHIMNIKSVPTTREHYRNINLVLDEIELCFHPEYQRKLVDSLIRTIQRLKLNTFCSFNILMTTHSPFVLSDIPQSNILYMQDGHKAEVTMPESFAANVNNLLLHSFFLENGFMGEFAKKKIISLVDYLTKGSHKKDWNEEKVRNVVSTIGEPLLKEQLEELINEMERQ